jgi:hypothetical protein
MALARGPYIVGQSPSGRLFGTSAHRYGWERHRPNPKSLRRCERLSKTATMSLMLKRTAREHRSG